MFYVGLVSLGVGVAKIYGDYWGLIVLGICFIFYAVWEQWLEWKTLNFEERVKKLEKIQDNLREY